MKKTTEIVSRLISDEILLETKSGNVKISTDEDGKLNIGSFYISGNENTLIVDPVNNCVTASCLSVGVISASQYIGPIGGGGGGGGSPASPNNSVQFNNGGSFGGSSNLTFNPSTNVLSGTTAQFTTLSASNVLIFGTASLFTNPQSAYLVYSSSSNKLVAFPGLIVTGSITGSESISAVTISGTTAQFTSITGAIASPLGTLSSPSFSFIGDPNTGIYSPAADNISFVKGGVEVIRVNSSGNVGIGTTSPTFQLQVNTDSAAKPSTNTWTISSDIRVKENIQNYSKGLNVLLQLNPVTYDYNGKAGFDSRIKNNIGLIAQDIVDIIPESISSYRTKLNPEDTEDIELYNFNSHALTYIIINSIKELTSEIQQLKNQVQDLMSGSG